MVRNSAAALKLRAFPSLNRLRVRHRKQEPEGLILYLERAAGVAPARERQRARGSETDVASARGPPAVITAKTEAVLRALCADANACRIPRFLRMTTSYQPGDRVLTNVNGVEVEASVVRLSVDVEVKTADGKVWWRALSKVRPAADAAPKQADEGAGDSSAPSVPGADGNTASHPVDAAAPETAAAAPAADAPVAAGSEQAQAAPQTFAAPNIVPSGVPQETAERKRRKAGKGRR